MNPVMGSKMAGMERHQNHRPLQDADEDKTRHVSICVHSSKGRIVYFFCTRNGGHAARPNLFLDLSDSVLTAL